MHNNINTKQYWDDRWARSPMLSRKLEKIIMSLVDRGTSVLDIGCGSGRILRGLRKDKGCMVYGIDISQTALNMLHRYNIPGMVMDANEFSDETPYDVIILSHTLEHITDDAQLIAKLAKNTKQYLIVAVPNDCMGPEEEPEHVRSYTKDSLHALLGKHFPIIEDYSSGVHLILKCYA